MYRVAVIDDEPMVCRRLAEKVNWGKWDCTIIGTGANGLIGKDLIDRCQPDIVITDVKMPGMDGLQLADYISHNHPGTITIILSGYNDFDYVREAFRHKVYDYLLKPIDNDEFNELMNKVTVHLRMKAASVEQVVERIDVMTPMIESRLLLDYILNKNHKLKNADSIGKKLSLIIHKDQVIIYDSQNAWSQNSMETNRSIYQFAINNILNEIYAKHRCGMQVFWIADKCVVVAKFDSSIPCMIAEKRVQEATVEVVEQLKSYFKTRIYCSKGKFFNSIHELSASYQFALTQLENLLFWNLEFILTDRSSVAQAAIRVETLYKQINEGNEMEALRSFDELAEQLRKRGDIDFVYSTMLEMIINITNVTREWEVQPNFPTLNEIKKYALYDELIKNLRASIELSCHLVTRKRFMMHSPLMDKIVLFVKDHYDHPDMSLQFISEAFQLSIGHLSRLFKRELGVNFNDFLVEERLEKAKKLLIDKYQMSGKEVANLVGFKNGKYFAQVFKNHYGMTPSVYREKILDSAPLLSVEE